MASGLPARCGLAICVAATPACASFPRINENADLSTKFWASERFDDRVKSKQHFVNNMQTIDSVAVYVKWSATDNDYVYLNLADGSGAGVTWHYSGGRPLMLSEKPNSGEGWVTIPLVWPRNVTPGEYMVLEVTARYASIGYNLDRYVWGRRVRALDNLAVAGPRYRTGNLVNFALDPASQAKKEDLLFKITGTVTAETIPREPVPTTNVASPYFCIPIYPEKAPNGSPANAINVLFREAKKLGDGTTSRGSFYDADLDAWKTILKTKVIQPGPGGGAALSNTEPFASRFATAMNFYIAREDSSWDPEYLRGFLRCANIDIVVDIGTGVPEFPYSGPGQFHTHLVDPTNNDQQPTLLHELLHSVGGAHDEYVGNVVSTTLLPNWQYTINSAPLNGATNACADPTSANWCASSISVDELRSKMVTAGDPNGACWTYTSPTECASNAMCHDVSGLGVPYYGTYTCVPKTIVNYDIGQGCPALTGCYIGAASAFSSVALNVAQPDTILLQSSHSLSGPAQVGYGEALRPQMEQLMQCLFPTTCVGYPEAACSAFHDRWDGGAPNAGNLAFLRAAKGCDNGVWRRR